MDYNASGNPKLSKDHSRQKDPNLKPGKALRTKGATKPTRHAPPKEELLARMKAAAEAKRQE